ncbi:MAG: 50S ribosomal protein L24 [Desulfovibrionaceae bacterium]|nr:50S ribosomal protein L24 [Desulfovibrionaceae bacterium]
MRKFRIHKDDKVLVISGRDRGKIGRVLRVVHKHDTVVVEKINMVRRHQKGNPYIQQPGKIIDKEMPLHISNVLVVCEACGKATRIGYREIEVDGRKQKVRFCKKCNEDMK